MFAETKALLSSAKKLWHWVGGLVEGRMDGWMDGWVEGKAGLRIAYSNHKMIVAIRIIS